MSPVLLSKLFPQIQEIKSFLFGVRIKVFVIYNFKQEKLVPIMLSILLIEEYFLLNKTQQNNVYFYLKMHSKSNLKSFYWWMSWSPCGSLLIVPGG